MKKMINDKIKTTGKGKGLEDLVHGNPNHDHSDNEMDQTVINKGDSTPLKSDANMEAHSATKFGRNASQ